MDSFMEQSSGKVSCAVILILWSTGRALRRENHRKSKELSL